MSQGLHTVLQHAERQRDEALAALAQAQDALQRHQLQAEQLHSYTQDYAARDPARDPARKGQAAAIELLRCHLAFMDRLAQANQQQLAQVQATHKRCEHLRQLLVQQETYVAAVRKLLEKRVEAQRLRTQKREQQRSDEAASQKLWRERAELADQAEYAAHHGN
jgi:flagellar protein FliJ